MCMHAGTEGLGTQCVPAFESSEEMARAATGDRRAYSSVPLCSAQNDGAGDGGNPSTACGGPPPLDRGGLQEREAEIAAILAALPEEPSDAAMEYIRTDDCIEEIGANLLIWERVPMIRETVPLKQTMGPEDWEEHEKGLKPYWGLKCRCTFCGERWEGRWIRGKDETLIVLDEEAVGYIGFGIDGWEEGGEDGEKVLVTYDGGEVTCPCCGRWLHVKPKRWLRGKHRTWRLRMTTVECCGQWGGVFYWMADIPLDDDGDGWLNIEPETALIVSRSGKLLEFRHEDGAWSYRRRYKTKKAWTPLEQIERDLREEEIRKRIAPISAEQFWSDTCQERKKGRWISYVGYDAFHEQLVSEEGTLEKTGCKAFCIDPDTLNGEPWMAEAYLRYWAEQPRIEVIARDGWVDLTREILRGDYPELLLDWTQTKPHKILGLSKEDYRDTGNRDTYRWTANTLEAFRRYNLGRQDPISAKEFDKLYGRYHGQLFKWLKQAREDESGEDGRVPSLQRKPEAWDLRRMDRYLQAHGGDPAHDLELLVDYRIAAEALNALHTRRDLWPKDLQAAHDKACESLSLSCSSSIEDELRFRKLREQLAPLTWTDGVYMIRAAASPQELQQEGAVLHHCIGTYVKTMAAMEDVIFFVRKYRRPERSWLTLDINMSGSRPTEAALHGWWNEGTPAEPGDPWKRPKRKIPKRGRNFVDRWKKEILEPWWEATHSAGKADGGKKKRKAG